MMNLIFFMIIGVGLLASFLVLVLQGRPTVSPDVSAVTAVGHMIRLGGLSFTNSKRLLDDSEYQMLLSNPHLQGLAKRLRSERRDLVLQWISVLQCDLKTLWRFRRFLVQRGAPVQMGEEFKILQTFVACWALLFTLKCSIRLAGPFAVAHGTRRAGAFVGRMSDAAASTLGRVPSAVWPELERSWMGQAA